MIDFHVHVYPPEVIRDAEAIARREPWFDLLIHNRVHKWATVEDLLARMEREEVERSVIFGFAFRDLGLCRLCNDYVIEAVRRYPDRLSGFCVIPPRTQGATAEILRCAEAGLIGVGELFPDGQGVDLSDRRQTWRLAGTLDEAGLCVLWHVAEPVGHDYAGKGSAGPAEAAAFCRNHPEAVTIFAHLGGGLWLYELMPEMRLALRNAWYDLAALPWLYGGDILRTLQTAGVLDKFLMGTDYPVLDSTRYERIFAANSKGDRASAGLDDDALNRLRHGNAARLLSILSSLRESRNRQPRGE